MWTRNRIAVTVAGLTVLALATVAVLGRRAGPPPGEELPEPPPKLTEADVVAYVNSVNGTIYRDEVSSTRPAVRVQIPDHAFTDKTLEILGEGRFLHKLVNASGHKLRPSKPEYVTYLCLSNTKVGKGLIHLAQLRNIEWLDLNKTEVSDDDLPSVARLQNLNRLELVGTRITPAGLKHLAPLTRLTDLRLNGTEVSDWTLTDDMLAALAENGLIHTMPAAQRKDGSRPAHPGEVTRADLSQQRNLTDAGVRHTTSLPNLASLALYRTRVSDAGLKEIATLKHLTFLSLADTAVTDAGIKHLATITTLTHLDLSITQVTAEGLRGLAPLKSLVWLGFPSRASIPTPYRNQITDEVLWALHDIEMLHLLKFDASASGRPPAVGEIVTLDLSQSPITDDGLKALTPLRKLSSLTLRNTRVTDAGVRELQVAIPKCDVKR